jgi:uncharacterized protein involved in exopolysaccharide biosynthesis
MCAAVLCAQIKRLLASHESCAAEHEGRVASLMQEIKALSDKAAAASQIEVRLRFFLSCGAGLREDGA